MSALATLPHRKFSVDEYHYFIEQGVFKPEERLELWEGEFIEMSPIGKKHAGSVAALSDMLKDFLGRKALVWAQNPIVLDDFSEPQPDVCLLQRREDFYRKTSAAAKDVLIVMEVADTTLKYDREVKFPRYAANGIEEAWLIDLENDRIEIHTAPTENGYSLIKILHRGQIAESSVLPELKISVDEILG
ncbi:MAG: Uma2 family endonuclease [Pyrinomonadaceae bacterium]